jgi:small subunit ribosomal protein S1
MELQRMELERLYARTFKGLQEDTIVDGRVIQVRDDGVIIDLCYKCEGFVPIHELMEDEHLRLKAGDVIPVYIIDTNDSGGFIKLSRRRAESIKTWSMLEEALKKGHKVEGKIVGKVKGGMTVNVNGLKAFLPGSHIDIKPVKNSDQLIGQSLYFKVIKLDDSKSNVILSRRLLLEEERERLREETLKTLNEGALVKGMVKNLTDYGAFIDLGGVDGLLHISDMSWGRISHPAELFRIGDEVEVIVLSFDRGSERVTLGYKQKRPDPWSLVDERYKPGQKVTGKVVGMTDYGIFLELEEGIEGLVHVSEIDWTEKIKKPSKYFAIGDVVEAMLLSVDKNEKRISLSIKQLKPNPWNIIKERYRVGQKITGI